MLAVPALGWDGQRCAGGATNEQDLHCPGVNSLSLSSTLSRRSAGAADSGAEPGAAESGAEPGAVLGRADSNAVNANSFQKYCVEGIVAVLGSMLLGMVLCCVLHVWRKRRK